MPNRYINISYEQNPKILNSTQIRPFDLPTSQTHDDPKKLIVELLPNLRAFARFLTHNPAEADDLLQETLVKALDKIHQFTPGTNMRAWLFTIERNIFYSRCRKRSHEGGRIAENAVEPSCEPEQEWKMKMKAMHRALNQLPKKQREVLMLVSGAGLSYVMTAEMCGCAVGTIKSRVNRARIRLLTLLQVKDPDEFLETDRHG
jgi:RNA polymerase sigma-70 factor (ECF subfamily)